jgi:hypothetical protein
MLEISYSSLSDEVLSPNTWSLSTASVSNLKSDDLPMLDESIALETACDDLDHMVMFAQYLGIL